MKLSVIIVSYNVKYYLQQCIESVRRATNGIDAEICVIDNHSRDNTVGYLRKHNKDLRIIASNYNNGFARANNIFIQQTESEYVLLLNPDTIVGEDVLHQCISFMDSHPQAGGVGVRMLKADGSDAMESRRGLPTPMTSFYKMCGLCNRFPNNKRLGRYYMGYLPWDQPGRIEVISGAFFFIRREALDKAGLLDEDFFMYGEDIDLSYRLLKNGYQNWYLPIKILHYKGESTQKSSFRYVHIFYEAMLIFFRKHYGHTRFWLTVPIKAAIYMKASFALVSTWLEQTRKTLGFSYFKNKKRPHYLFIGNNANMKKFKQIAQRNGLWANYVVGNETTHPNGHLDMADIKDPKQPICVVYDTKAFRYATILDIFSRRPEMNVHIGTFNPDKGIIITDKETIN